MALISGLRDVLSYNSLVHAVAGATGGFTAMTVFYPLDTVRVILQVDDEAKAKSMIQLIREIFEKQGIKGFYKGWFPVISSLWCSNFVYFYSYNILKLLFYGKTKPTPWKDMGAASLAGIINVYATTPMWVVNTRLKLQGSLARMSSGGSSEHYQGMLDCFSKIIKKEGVATLWNGTGPSLILVCNPTIQFVVYEALKRRFLKLLRVPQLGSLTLFLIAAIAKAVATLLTYPVQMVQSRMRAHSRNGDKPMSIKDCVYQILRNKGPVGLYKGIEAKLLQTIAMAALMFMTYERISMSVFTIMGIRGR
ncbi:peroxisomal membrane protein PMP34-like [Watersipora subatra]|uniref:peroxisomal membrane protein PMP34-like n=1 Tax=Watersipora subatra TaxID=2589382 RepID=UPI00355BF21D